MEEEILRSGRKRFSIIGFLMIGFTALAYGLQYLAIFVIEKCFPSIKDDTNTYTICVMVPLFIIEIVVFLVGNKKIEGDSGNKKKLKPVHWIMGLLISFAAMYLSNIIGLIATYLIGVAKGSSVTNPILDTVSGMNTITTILVVAVAAPILEELVFRKMLIDKMSQYGEKIAVFTSALMFALFHGNLNQFVYAFVLGVIFGFIYVKTRNIKYTIFMHMIINFMGSVVAMNVIKLIDLGKVSSLLSESTEAYMEYVMNNLVGFAILEIYLLMLFGFVIAGIVLFFVNKKKFVFEEKENDIPKGQGFKTVFANPGIIVFCIIWVARIIIQLLL